jgi:hypothetical protein
VDRRIKLYLNLMGYKGMSPQQFLNERSALKKDLREAVMEENTTDLDRRSDCGVAIRIDQRATI